MKLFAILLDILSTTQGRSAKINLLTDYFRSTANEDRGWALAALTDGLPLRFNFRRILSELVGNRSDPHLFKLSRDFVGDTAETIALLWSSPTKEEQGNQAPPDLSTVVRSLLHSPSEQYPELIASILDMCSIRERWAFLKLIGGAPRVGLSARLAKTAVAHLGGKEVTEIEEIWHALKPPYAELFAWVEGRGERPDLSNKPVFRPLMLSMAIEESDWINISPSDFAAEWKWDGIRTQIAVSHGEVRLYSRTGDDISHSFPEICSSFSNMEGVADGELLVVREGSVASFNDLQQRLNRKNVKPRLLKEYPAFLRLYDLLMVSGEDLRSLSYRERRERLLKWYSEASPPLSDISPILCFNSFNELESLWQQSRQSGIEGLMLKRWSSPYLAGRIKGHWFKWKRSPLTLDCVLMYAQRGSGKRSSLYSDLTFGVWQTATNSTEKNLVPVGKAYSGFTDMELRALDKFIRANTLETYGPVRAVEPILVLEIAFDSLQRSSRHKSGVAMRFPRIRRIRWDKPAKEADTLETTTALIK